MAAPGTLRAHDETWPCAGVGAMREKRPTAVDPDASALDRERLSARAVHAIERVWGRDAKRRHLLALDAYERLRQARGVGAHSITEIERAVAAWGFDGIGGKRGADPERRKQLLHRNRLNAALRAVGAKTTLILLSELSREQIVAHRQRLTWRPSRRHRARCERAILYYTQCEEHFRECARTAPLLEEG
jgi:hypothetical protein